MLAGTNMPQVLIRNIDEETLNALKKRAKNNNVSLQQELKSILENSASAGVFDAAEMARKIRDNFRKRGIRFGDSVKLIRQDRGR
jgi:plasmid stability protein